jgi:hypothetical protein
MAHMPPEGCLGLRDPLGELLVCTGDGLPVDPEDREEFEDFVVGLNSVGEVQEGLGSVPTTAWLMTDDEANELAARIIALAARYDHA